MERGLFWEVPIGACSITISVISKDYIIQSRAASALAARMRALGLSWGRREEGRGGSSSVNSPHWVPSDLLAGQLLAVWVDHLGCVTLLYLQISAVSASI